MKYMLRIGCDDYVLPDNRGLSTVMEALSRARLVPYAGRTYDERHNLVGFRQNTNPPDISVTPLPGSWKMGKADDKHEAVDCEVLPPARRELPGGRSLIGQRQRFMLEGGAE